MKPTPNAEHGFTLVELLVVMSIIGMLASVVLVAVQGARQKGQFAAAQTFAENLKSTMYLDRVAFFDFNDNTYNNQGSFSGSLNTLPNPAFTIVNDTSLHNSGYQLSIPSGSAGDNISNTAIGNAVSSLNYSFSLWMKPVTNPPYNNAKIIGVDSTGNALISNIIFPTGQIDFLIPSGSHLTKPYAFNANTWYAIAATVQNNGGGTCTAAVYVNGKLIGSASLSCSSVANVNVLTLDGDACCSTFPAVIDDVGFYSRGLLSSDVKEIYALGATKHGLAVK